ncbi:MAG: cell wall-binding repeat-containing protein [Peptostreptococcus sp.]|uniref:cell wall-binding repeat-containing protein n=1 Tax=Peptostreptococcus sp. TaxID=1262 RepID=UPI002FCAC7BA
MKLKKSFLTLGLALSISISFFTLNTNAAQKTYKRYAGKDRSETCLQTSGLMKVSQGKNIVIADGYSFADSLSAMNLANKYDAILLLDSNYQVDNLLIEFYLNLYQPENVYLVGGKESRKYDKTKYKNTNIVHIAGINRYETNKKSLEIAGYKNIGVASGENYADALSSYSLLREKNLGLMLVRPNENYNSNGLNIEYTFGGKNSVKKDAGERIAGSNRYDTSIKIAEKTNDNNIIFVSGNQFADALSSINLVNSKTGNILLTPTNGDKRVSKLASQADDIFVVGGKMVLPDKNIEYAIQGRALTVNNPNLISNISGYNLDFNIPKDLANTVSFKKIDYLQANDLAFSMKSPESGDLFTIYVSDYSNDSSDGFHERNIGTLKQNGKNYSVFMNIGAQPNYSNKDKYINALNKLSNAIENGALSGTNGSSFTLNKGFYKEMKDLFIPKIKAPTNSNELTIPGTNGKSKIILPANIISRVQFSSDGYSILNKNIYLRTHDEIASTSICMVNLIDYVGTDSNTHIASATNTYGTVIKNGKKYSLYVDSHKGPSLFGTTIALSQSEYNQLDEDNRAIVNALINGKTSGIIH